MGGYAQEDIFEVHVRREDNQVAALHERIEQRRAPRALETPCKEPVLAADRYDAELIFGAIVIDGEATIFDKALQGHPLIREIPQRVAERRFRQHDASKLV